MGRLDDAAKRKVVELRKAGLSFRKIKAVLELENIKVSAQAIYYFLREFQGRPPGRVRPVRDFEVGSSSSSSAPLQQHRASQDSWSLQSLRREVSHHGGFAGVSNLAKQSMAGQSSGSGSGEVVGSGRLEQHQQEDKEESDIQIVSVTSLAQRSQQLHLPPAVTVAETSTASSHLATGVPVRRRVTASPATRSMLAARRRLLDKALSQRMKQVASSLRRDHVSPHSAAHRNAASQPSESYDLTTEQTDLKGQPAGLRRFLSQRAAPPAQPPHSLPRVGIRLPNQSHSPLAHTVPRPAPIRLQTHAPQAASRSEGGSTSPQQVGPEATGRGGLHEQIQSLGCEVHSLGLAVKMLVEQQVRLEKEQAQQTAVQRQILGTLRSLASRVGTCSSAQPQQRSSEAPSPSRLPLTSASMPVSQDAALGFSGGPYAECSRAPPSYDSLEALEAVEAFKLPELSPASINGFPPCSSDHGGLPLGHAYQQQGAQTVATSFAQPFAPSYGEPQSLGGVESRRTNSTSSCSDCGLSAPQQEQHISCIKVEGP